MAVPRRVMAGRAYRNESIRDFASHDQVNRLTGGAGAVKPRPSTSSNRSIAVEIAGAFADYPFDLFVQLRSVRRLHITARRFPRLHLEQV